MAVYIKFPHIMNKFFLLILLLGIATVSVFAQKLEIQPKTGIGFYSMSDLKDFQKSSIPKFGIDIQCVETFPHYFFYEADMVIHTALSWGYGFTGGFYSTGARNHYADYSGSYKVDFLTSAINLGGVLLYRQNIFNHTFIDIKLASGIKYSQLGINEVWIFWTDTEKKDYTFQSYSGWIKPEIKFGQIFFDSFTIGGFVGYEYNLKSKLHYKEDKDLYLMKAQNDYVKIDWSGFRAGLFISYLLH